MIGEIIIALADQLIGQDPLSGLDYSSRRQENISSRRQKPLPAFCYEAANVVRKSAAAD